MAAKPPPERIIILMPKDLVDRIEDFRFAQRIPTRAEAIRTLIKTGLRHPPKPK